ncbi:radical SAM family heme chaperone HemW [Aureivirga sp. CE67]|uniref:radical SAM family heme chaperone HemW n=1 Tax=Aureivirga sp. CE67 TaxID=1788983 RepID=UPI0018CAC7C3|nr:radical SAM family heme chaperone HemW [Aureivirga sp. CE67]
MAGIYIHIPFCKQACYYCDFHFSTSLKYKERMVNAICAEIELRKETLEKETIETIYFGGGTPSLLSIAEIKQILNTIYTNFSVVENPEITLEANPDDLSTEKLMDLSKTPINRLSIGIQSFFEEDLQFMNRAHSAIEARKCIEEAQKVGFENITIDLIYGVPNMEEAKWRKNLEIAFDLNIPHISSYALTVEEKTVLDSFIKKGRVKPLDENLAFKHFQILVKETKKNGFVHYEISNFGKPDFFSKHNTSYWQGKKYLGVGPSAHSFDGKNRAWNLANNMLYMKEIEEKKLPLEIEELSKIDCYNEYVMTGLRTIFGVSLEKIENDFGLEMRKFLEKEIKPFLKQGTLELKDNFLFITEKGKFLADGIASDLFYV